MKHITLYTWPHCPFCRKAKRLLDDKGYPYNEINIYGNNAKKQELTNMTGQTTVPYIFIGDKLLGVLTNSTTRWRPENSTEWWSRNGFFI